MLFILGLFLTFSFVSPASSVFATNNEIVKVEEFIDNIMTSKIEEYNIPNATVSLVMDGEVLFKKGYGLQDIEKKLPVDADTTLFRIGSTSKLFTWTAVMQLVEVGKLDLDEDINTYLDFEIPYKLEGALENTTAEAITLSYLMTHTAGFEDYVNNLFRLHPQELIPFDEYIKEHLPARIFPPGEVMAYSNYGTALAGYIVERISGMPFSEYVEENIFSPLGMNHTIFKQPLPQGLHDDMSKAYRFTDDSFKEGSFEYVIPTAAGSGSSSASDMARFMLAHLESGSYNGAKILNSATVDLMHQQRFTHHPTLGGMTLGFIEGTYNHKRVIFHGGATMLYSTGLYLIPEEDIGLFISYSGGGHYLYSEVFQSLMDYLYPVEAPIKEEPPAGSMERSKQYIGEYQMNRKSVTTSEKITSLLMGPIHVKGDESGHLIVNYLGETSKFIELEPGVYKNLREGRSQDYNGPFSHIVFKEDPMGNILLASGGPMTYSKAPFYATSAFTVSGILISLLIILLSLIFWLLKKVLAFIKKRPKASGLPLAAQWVAIAFGIAVLILLTSFLSSGSMDPVYQMPKDAYTPSETGALYSILPILLYGLTLGLIIFTAMAWWKKLWGMIGRIHYSLYSVAALLLMFIFHYWNILK
ncbi:serine hydrolase [Alkaliphilus serpentinus]|uniref:Serine hydrolase n=1 Tax=Alkaliphilus serpentinus TaxID=1482731 RepID=A0A833HNA0_9FIRM|nr:serine hydrolase [Alkaliphilus serpentinus]